MPSPINADNPLVSWPGLEHWAVVGVSENTQKYGYKIFMDLKNAGYTVYPVNPKLNSIEGLPCYPDILSLPITPEVVNLVIPPAATLKVIEDCAKKGVKRIWFQPGSESTEALNLAKKFGIQTLDNACIMIQKQQFN